MKKKNKAVVIIIVLLVVIALAVGGVLAVNEFVLNKPKDLFNKYTVQNFSEVFSFDTSFMSEIENNNSGKTRQTKSDIEILGSNGIKVETDLRVDKQNNKSQIDIDLKKGNKSILKVQGLNNGDKYAFKSDPIANGYIGIENNKLDKLAEKLGLNIENVPNKIEITKGDFENNKRKILSKLKDEYLPIITSKFAEDKYSKEKNVSVKIDDVEYAKATKLTLNTDEKELIDSLTELLKKAKEDNELLEKMMTYNIDSYKSEIKEQYKNQLDSLEKALADLDSTGSVQINTYIQKDKVIKTDIVFEDGGSISIYKAGDTKRIIITSTKSNDFSNILDENTNDTIGINNSGENKVEFALTDSISDNNQELVLQILVNDKEILTVNGRIKKMDNGNSIDLEFVLSDGLINEDGTYTLLSITQKTEYKDNVKVDDLTNSNSMILNNYSEKQIQSLMEQLLPLLAEVAQDTIGEISSGDMNDLQQGDDKQNNDDNQMFSNESDEDYDSQDETD